MYCGKNKTKQNTKKPHNKHHKKSAKKPPGLHYCTMAVSLSLIMRTV